MFYYQLLKWRYYFSFWSNSKNVNCLFSLFYSSGCLNFFDCLACIYHWPYVFLRSICIILLVLILKLLAFFSDSIVIIVAFKLTIFFFWVLSMHGCVLIIDKKEAGKTENEIHGFVTTKLVNDFLRPPWVFVVTKDLLLHSRPSYGKLWDAHVTFVYRHIEVT